MQKLRAHAHNFFDFAVGDPARMQLMFQRVIPGFTPSATAYAVSQDVFRVGALGLADAGADDPAAVDVWTALLMGLASQQVGNDPGGDRMEAPGRPCRRCLHRTRDRPQSVVTPYPGASVITNHDHRGSAPVPRMRHFAAIGDS